MIRVWLELLFLIVSFTSACEMTVPLDCIIFGVSHPFFIRSLMIIAGPLYHLAAQFRFLTVLRIGTMSANHITAIIRPAVGILILWHFGLDFWWHALELLTDLTLKKNPPSSMLCFPDWVLLAQTSVVSIILWLLLSIHVLHSLRMCVVAVSYCTSQKLCFSPLAMLAPNYMQSIVRFVFI